MSMPPVRAPEFPEGLAWLNTDRPLRLHEELRGQVVLLDFWTYCCINCVHILPDLAYLEEKYAADPVTIIGVHSHKYPNEAVPANIAQAIARLRIQHPVVADTEHAIWNTYGIHAWPTLVLIDAAGRVMAAFSGEGHREELDRFIAGLLEVGRNHGTLADGPLPAYTPRRRLSFSGLAFPGKVLADPISKRLFIADTNHHRIVITNWNGDIRGFLGSGVPGFIDGAYEEARFQSPQGMTIFGGSLYIADTDNHAIRRADLASLHVHTVAGNGMIGYDRHGGHRGREQVLNSPWDVAFLNGMLCIAMAGLHQIWIYDPRTEEVRVAIGTGREDIADNPARKAALAQTSGLAAANGVLYFADAETSAVRQYDPATGAVTTLVGRGLFEFGDTDGTRAQALFQHPLGVAADGDFVYVADTYNHKIRRIDLRGDQVTTVAGTGTPGYAANTQLALHEPGGLSVAGNHLFIADTNNDRVIHYRLDSGQWEEVVPRLQGQALGEAA